MSSELIEDIEDDRGTAVFLSMQKSGHAQLTLLEADEDKAVAFELTPDLQGCARAEAIARALKAWREKILCLSF
jgi:hypothetical protein